MGFDEVSASISLANIYNIYNIYNIAPIASLYSLSNQTLDIVKMSKSQSLHDSAPATRRVASPRKTTGKDVPSQDQQIRTGIT